MEENCRKIVFLCSGGGGNLRFVDSVLKKGCFGPSSLVAVITDRDCGANNYARNNGINEKLIDFSNTEQSELIKLIDFYEPDVIITTIHQILHEAVIQKYRGRLINVHYSILPGFSGSIGTKPIKNALLYGSKLMGITVHMVDEILDGGLPLIQVAIPVKCGDNLENLVDIHFRCGCLSLALIIRSIFSPQFGTENQGGEVIKIKDRNCFFSSKVNLPFDFQNEAFWKSIKV